jgi:hypothetical protein
VLGQLYYSEASPPLFLAVEMAAADLLGHGTFALRLVPLLASCSAIMILVFVAQKVLPAIAAVWFALLLSCSDRLLWHCTEAKPYCVDLLVAAGVLAILTPQSTAGRIPTKLLLGLTLLTPLLVFISFPATFVLGGAVVTLLPSAWRGQANRWVYAALAIVLAGSFLMLDVTAIHAQKDERMLACWANHFPAWDSPWLVPAVTVVRLTEACRYAAEPVGNLLAPLAVIGGVWLWRSGQRRLLGLTVWPLGLNVVAWLMNCYPLDASRVMLYNIPAALLLISTGIHPAWQWLTAKARMAPLLLGLVLLAPLGQTAFFLVQPWPRLDSATPVKFVLEHRQRDEPVVGILWEQAYYCHDLGNMYRPLVPEPKAPPSVPAAAELGPDGAPNGRRVRSLWLLTRSDPAEQTAHIAQLQPAGAWRITSQHAFRDVTVLHVSAE